jgi:hypothetical protein
MTERGAIEVAKGIVRQILKDLRNLTDLPPRFAGHLRGRLNAMVRRQVERKGEAHQKKGGAVMTAKKDAISGVGGTLATVPDTMKPRPSEQGAALRGWFLRRIKSVALVAIGLVFGVFLGMAATYPGRFRFDVRPVDDYSNLMIQVFVFDTWTGRIYMQFAPIGAPGSWVNPVTGESEFRQPGK